jgi:predicted ribosomally synthesized peptide with SipW-like signal peptide
MRRILLGVGTIVFVGALVVGGTGAFFSDTETSTGNTFAAGAIDLLIDNTSYGFDWNDSAVNNPTGEWGRNEANSWQLSDLTGQLFFDFHDLKPGDYGEDTISIHVNDNDAYACMAFNLTGTPENGQNEPEAEVDETAGANEGELQEYLSFLFWFDDGDNVLEDGEQVIDALSGLPGSIFTGEWLPIAEGGDVPLAATSTHYIGKGWCFGDITPSPVEQDGTDDNPPSAPERIGFTCDGAGDHNDAQTDGIVVDVHFYAEQSRNNGDFLCENVPPVEDGDNGELVGALLSAYSEPVDNDCDATVEGGESIQTAIDSEVSENETVCVAPSYNGAGDDSLIRISKDGVKVAALVRGIDLDVPVVLDNDNTVITGFTGFVGQAESVSEVAAFYIDGDADNVEISYNDVDGGENGVLTETSATLTGALIKHNTFENLTRGIFFNPSKNMVAEFNDFFSNTVGVANDEPHDNTLRFNVFSGNDESVGYLDEANGGIANNGLLDVNFNNIYDGEVNNYSASTTLDATNNWWGGDGPADNVNQSGPDTAVVNTIPEAVAAFPEN